MFSWERLKGLLSFGWKMLASSLLDTIYTNIRSLIIGKLYSSADLAYYNQHLYYGSVDDGLGILCRADCSVGLDG